MIDLILSLISFTNIVELPWKIQLPGLMILAWLFYRLVRSIMTFKPIKAFSSVISILLVAIVLSRFGNTLALLFGVNTSQ